MTKILMSQDNPNGHKLEELLLDIISDLEIKTRKIENSLLGPAITCGDNNRKLIALLKQCEDLQNDTLSQLDKLGKDTGPTNSRIELMEKGDGDGALMFEIDDKGMMVLFRGKTEEASSYFPEITAILLRGKLMSIPSIDLNMYLPSVTYITEPLTGTLDERINKTISVTNKTFAKVTELTYILRGDTLVITGKVEPLSDGKRDLFEFYRTHPFNFLPLIAKTVPIKDGEESSDPTLILFGGNIHKVRPTAN